MNQAIYILFVVGIGVALPAEIVWGWVRWAKRKEPRSTSSTLSLMGFILASLSGLLAIVAILCACVAGGFRFYDPWLLKIFRWEILLSLAALMFAIIGVWRPNALRWHALFLAVGMLVFWLAAAAGE